MGSSLGTFQTIDITPIISHIRSLHADVKVLKEEVAAQKIEIAELHRLLREPRPNYFGVTTAPRY